MKRRASFVRLGLTFAGCFLGAGYVSGRELWQFFGRYGAWGWPGLVLAVGGLGALGAMTLLLVRETGETALEKLVIPWEIPALRAVVFGFSLLFLFGIDSIMTAGAAALFQQSLGLPRGWAGLGFSALVAALTLTGLEGMVLAFSAIVPFLTASAVVLGALALARGPETRAGAAEGGAWLLSAVTFAAYNMFSSVAILAPLGRGVPKKTALRAVAFGAALLLLIAAVVLLALGRAPDAAAEELPMLSLAGGISPAAAFLLALELLCAMLGTAFSCFLTGVDQLAACVPRLRARRKTGVFALSALVWGASLFGFGKLIDVVYPAFGLCSIVFLLSMGLHFRRVRKAAGLTGRAGGGGNVHARRAQGARSVLGACRTHGLRGTHKARGERRTHRVPGERRTRRAPGERRTRRAPGERRTRRAPGEEPDGEPKS